LCERLQADGPETISVDNYFTVSRRNIAHHLFNPLIEAMRHDMPIKRL
jgi:UDP-glucuronate decarboxylase